MLLNYASSNRQGQIKGHSRILCWDQAYFCSMMEFFNSAVSFAHHPCLQLSVEVFPEYLFWETGGFIFPYSDSFIVPKVVSSQSCLSCLRDLKVDHEVGHHQQARGVNITHAKCGINAKEAVYLVKFH